MASRFNGRRCCRGGLLSEPIIKNRRAELVCHDCEDRFLAVVPHEAVVSRQEIKGWVPAKGSTRDVTCPECGSVFVRVLQ
jgi:Zn finger protein HypA/HybF involved in hydrogenase expression